MSEISKWQAKVDLLDSLVSGIELVVKRQDKVIEAQKSQIENLRMFIKAQSNSALEILEATSP